MVTNNQGNQQIPNISQPLEGAIVISGTPLEPTKEETMEQKEKKKRRENLITNDMGCSSVVGISSKVVHFFISRS